VVVFLITMRDDNDMMMLLETTVSGGHGRGLARWRWADI